MVQSDRPGECTVLRSTVVGSSDRCFDSLSGSHHQSQENSCCQSNVLRKVRVIRLASLAVMYRVRFLCYHRTSPVPPLPHSQLSLSQHKVKNLETLMPDNQIFFFLGGGLFLLILFHRYKYKIYPPSRSVYDTHIYITCPYTYISLESISVPGVAVK